MLEDRKADLRQTITLFESLLERYKLNRDRLYARRCGATDHVMVEIDDRLAANARTIESFERAVECLRTHLDSLESHADCGGLLTGATTSPQNQNPGESGGAPPA